MRHELSISLVCGAFLGWSASSSVAYAAAPKPSYAETRVEVDASKLERGGSTMEKSVASMSRNEVLQAVTQGLGKHVTVVDEGGEAVVHVELLWREYETSYYGVRIEVRRGSEAELVAVDECKLCDEEKLAAKVASRVPEVLAYLVNEQEEPEAQPREEPQPEAEPGASPPTQEQQPSPEEDDGPGYRRVGVAGYVGIASLALGVAGLAGGIPVLLEEPTTGARPNDDYVIETRDRVPLGATLVGIGGGLLLTGAVLVAVDQTVLRKRRARRGAVTLVPSLSPTGANLGLVGRF